MSQYEITYIVSDIFGTYVIYKMIKVFFDKLCTSKRTEILSYIAYYFVNLLLFFTVRRPIVLLVTNIFLFFCLTLNYRGSIVKKMIFPGPAYIALVLIETLVAVFTGYFSIPVFGYTEYDSSIGMVLIRIFSMLLVTILTNLKNIKKDIPVPKLYWVSTIFICLASLYQFVIFFAQGYFNRFETVVLIISILGTNFIVLFLYDTLYQSFSIKTEKILLEQQNKAYEKQLEIMRQSLDAVQVVRHDMKNHMITLKNLYEKNESIDFKKYIDTIILSTDATNLYSNSGNTIINSILNYKLQSVADMDVNIDIDVNAPENISISPYDMTVILGNLLDNSITALKNIKDCDIEKNFSVKISYRKENLIITVINSFSGKVKQKKGKLQTLKEDVKNHGLGLKSVQESVDKNDGYMSIQYNDKIFKTTVLLPT